MLHDESGPGAVSHDRGPERSLTSRAPDIAELLSFLAGPDLDDFDLDLRVGELWQPGGGGCACFGPQAAQTDGAGCLPTGGKGTCNTADPTCPNTCDDATCLNTCPNTCAPTCRATCAGQTCGNTCAPTCPNTCRNTCARTCDGFTCDGEATCARTCNNTHCFTCRPGCRTP